MSVRSKWANVDKETRKYILKRDKNKCVLCGNKGALTMAHIFLSRSHGGKGCKENIVSLCTKCHYFFLDNPIGNDNYLKSQEYLAYCKRYLQEKENFEANKDFLESLKYKKEIRIFKEPIKQEKIFDRCKDCRLLIKKTQKNSSIGHYYCKYRKIRINKTTKACEDFRKIDKTS